MFDVYTATIGRSTLLLTAVVGSAICITTAASAQIQTETTSRVDIALTYATARSTPTVNVGNFWLQGGGLDLHARIAGGLGGVASITGLHIGKGNAGVAPLDLVVTVFGLRYTVRPTNRDGLLSKTSMFVEGLGGEANGFHSVFSTGSGPVNNFNGTTDSANSLAVQAGGGLDFRLTRRLALRALQADYLRTQLPNGGTNVQNNLRLGAGVVLLFPR